MSSSSVGETLRRERLQKGLSLDQISRETKITNRLLDAIEKDQLDRLPGGVFAKSFVRQYARFLGLDEDELAAEVEKAISPVPELPGFATTPEPTFKLPRVTEWESTSSRSNSSVLPALALVVAVMLVCSAVYAWWQRSRHPAPVPQPVAAVHKVETPPPAKSPEPAPVTPAVANNPATPPKTEVAQSTPASTEPAQTQPVESPAPSNPAAALHAALSADSDTWVQVWADGKTVIIGVLHPEVVKNVEAVESIRIRTGNAGSLQLTVDGKPAGPIGPKGQIRTVEITPKGVQILVPPPKPAPALDPL